MSTRITHGSVRRGRSLVLHPGAVEIPCGVVTGLVGINGAGKSTWMLHTAGLLRGSPNPLRAIGYSPQRPTFPEWLSARRVASMFGCDFDALSAEFPALLLQELEDIAGSEFSAGQSQTLSIALALAAGAPITLLDEPFAPLDFRRRIALSSILREVAAQAHAAVVISTQSASEILDVCGWIVVLRDGRYEYAGPVSSLAGDGDAQNRRGRLEEQIMTLMVPPDAVTCRPAGSR